MPLPAFNFLEVEAIEVNEKNYDGNTLIVVFCRKIFIVVYS